MPKNSKERSSDYRRSYFYVKREETVIREERFIVSNTVSERDKPIVGYSSYGHFSKLSSILELEAERKNGDAEDIRLFINKHPGFENHKSIWITYDPVHFYGYYVIGIDSMDYISQA